MVRVQDGGCVDVVEPEVRSDDPASLVAARLRRSGYPILRRVACEVRDGVVVLSGTVPSFHLKQLAQALAAHTPGVGRVDNRVCVVKSIRQLPDAAGAP